jgi:phosphomannomutase
MNKLRLASFGIRGFVGESLPPSVVIDFASAFATYADGGRILLGRDTRYSSPMIHSAVLSGLLSAGCEVLDFGVCPTPMLQYAVNPYRAAGAISISGGHNAPGWNAVTLIGADGAFLEPFGGETVLDCFHARDFLRRDWQGMGTVRRVGDFALSYFDAMADMINVNAIREADFTVLIDPVGGAGCSYLPLFADRFRFHLVPINAQPSGYLAREPEPRPRSALQMASIIPHTGGDVGFVLSSDMSRMSVVTETGEPMSEEYTLALIADHVLAKRSGTLITNICTTRTVDDVARAHGAPVMRTRVGQAYVLAALADEQGVLGGEGSGSVALPEFSNAFDGFLMMALVLEAMAESGRSVSALLGQLPRYGIVKRSVPCGSRDGYRAIDALKDHAEFLGDGVVDMTDGLRVDWEDSWVHVRISQTQQLVRVIAEATTKERAEQRADDATRVLQQIV